MAVVTTVILVLANLVCPAVVSATNSPSPALPAMTFTNVQDYGFMWWSNGPSSSFYGIKTSRYALLFNRSTLAPTALFPVLNPSPEAAVLTEGWADSFPPSSPPVSFSCRAFVNGVTNAVGKSSDSSGTVQLVECGKFFQRRWQRVNAGALVVNPNVSGLRE